MLRVKRTFHAFTADGMRTVAAGAELPDDDPLVDGREDLFEPVEEQAKPKARRKPGPKPKAKDADEHA